ncbi:MAG: hypothetical protein JXR46_13650 [Calditrichaceae bacterium]|nr:hypothetical protein [Calditrichaceae bacterium]MBN2710080.1 hypothetical protein [Calditrichaceae bacterium]RQV94504.1 MAG: hypothetical protein EH224_10190 [Calditrichota bacterium]
MKITLKREFDGKYYIGSIAGIPGCYVQSESSMQIPLLMKNASSIFIKSFRDKNQTITNEDEKPIFNLKIRFEQISTSQIKNLLKSRNYYVEYQDRSSLLMVNSNFPFNRVHLPQTDDLSPLIIQKLIGRENTIFVRPQNKNRKSRFVI